MEGLEKKYAALKSRLSVLIRKIDKVEITEASAETLQKQLQEIWQSMCEVQEGMIEVSDEENFNGILTKHAEEESRFLDALLKLVNTKGSTVSGLSQSTSGRDVRLPPLQLPTFNGDVGEWKTFHDLFTAVVHQNSSLSDAEKMKYLKSSVKGKAATVISHLVVSNENYNEAWELLRQLYENHRFIVDTSIESSTEDHKLDPEGEYPNDWFKKNPGKKPPLTVGFKQSTLNELLTYKDKSSNYYIRNRFYSLPVAKAILFKYSAYLECELLDDWETEHVTIGKAGTKVTPMSLFEVTETETSWEGEITTTKTDDPEKVVATLLTLYRVLDLPQDQETSKFIEELESSFAGVFNFDPVVDLSKALEYTRSWDEDLMYRRIVAGYDMFFNKFKDHPLARLRFGTQTSRWRDCIALKNVFKTCSTLGIPSLANFMEWIWDAGVASDMTRLMKRPIQLTLNNEGYFFYMADMGLVSESAYSVTLNPYIYIFCKVISAALGYTRGIEAIMIQQPKRTTHDTMRSIVSNAMVVAFVFKTKPDWKMRFGPAGQPNPPTPQADDTKSLVKEDGTVSLPDDKNPSSWLALCEEYRIEHPKFEKFERHVQRTCRHAEFETVGQYLTEHLDREFQYRLCIEKENKN